MRRGSAGQHDKERRVNGNLWDLDDTTTQRHLDFSDGEVFGWKVSKVEVEE